MSGALLLRCLLLQCPQLCNRRRPLLVAPFLKSCARSLSERVALALAARAERLRTVLDVRERERSVTSSRTRRASAARRARSTWEGRPKPLLRPFLLPRCRLHPGRRILGLSLNRRSVASAAAAVPRLARRSRFDLSLTSARSCSLDLVLLAIRTSSLPWYSVVVGSTCAAQQRELLACRAFRARAACAAQTSARGALVLGFDRPWRLGE